MAELKTLVSEKSCVVLVDSVDPYCLKAVEIFQMFTLEPKNFNLYFVDKHGNSGAKILDQSRALAKESLPHVFIQGKLFCAGQNLTPLQNEHALRNVLAGCGAVTLAKIDKVEDIIDKSKFVVFLNSFSPYSLNAKTMIETILEKNDTKSLVDYVFVDNLTDGPELEQAALFLGKADNLPVFFAAGEALGGLNQLKQLQDSFEIFDVLGKAGILKRPAHDRLKELRKGCMILMVGNQYSAFSLEVQNILENMTLPLGALTTDVSEEVELAAKIATKNKNGPYIFLHGEVCDTGKFLDANKKGKMREFLASKKVIV